MKCRICGSPSRRRGERPLCHLCADFRVEMVRYLGHYERYVQSSKASIAAQKRLYEEAVKERARALAKVKRLRREFLVAQKSESA